MNINSPVVYRRVIVIGSANAMYLLWLAQQHYKKHHQQQRHNTGDDDDKEWNWVNSIINLSSAPEGANENRRIAFQSLLLHYA